MQAENFYGPNVIILYRCREYFLRANIWRPITKLQAALPNFSYDICHDHNFDILTVGYAGPGYRCRTYKYDYTQCSGLVGEIVDLVPTGIKKLPEGAIMFYRAKKDIHRQLPPDEISVSLNLIPRSEHIAEPQFQFDEDTGAIKRFIQSSSQELFLRFALALEAEDQHGCLRDIRGKSRSLHVRALAEALLRKSDGTARPAARSDGADRNSTLIDWFSSIEMEDPGGTLRACAS